MAFGDAPFLSILVPFHNSARTCTPLLEVLAGLDEPDVELIFVDDGSTDGTPQMLADFARSYEGAIQIVERSNGGPGAARNSGLGRALGRFVWFVDSDDRIEPRAIAHARTMDLAGVDLIAWDWDHPNIERDIRPGLHRPSPAPSPPDLFDPIVANWYSMEFMQSTGLRFPENCIYEATPIEAFVLPLLVKSYLMVDFVAYRGNADSDSVTRGGGLRDRHFDRLSTIPLGMSCIHAAGLQSHLREPFDAAFVRLFLWYSIRLSRLPGRSWLLAARVMRKFRDEARRFGIGGDPFDHYPGRRTSRRVLRMLWTLSAALPPQDRYFRRLHMRVWGREISWAPPALPPAGARESFPLEPVRP